MALSFGRALFKEMGKVAKAVNGIDGVTVGTLTPAARFTDFSGVPESTRYTVSNEILQHQMCVTQTQLDAIAQANAEQSRKRARVG
jgi:hypothetical protein